MWIYWFEIIVIGVVKVTQWCWLTLTGEKRFHRRVGLHQGSKSQTGCDPPHITVIRITWLDPHWWLLNFSEWWWFLRLKSSNAQDSGKLFEGMIFEFSCCSVSLQVIVHSGYLTLCTWDDTPSAKLMHFLCSQLHHAHRLLRLEIGWGGLSSQIPVSVSHLSHSLSQLTWVGSQTFPSLITIFIQLDGVPGLK